MNRSRMLKRVIDSGMETYSLQFDGVDDYVIIQDSDDFNFSSFTLMSWVKSSNFGLGRRRVISQQISSYFWLMAIYSNKLEFGSSLDGVLATKGVNLNDNSWHHVAVSREDGVSANWYVDGFNIGSEIITNTESFEISAPVNISMYDDREHINASTFDTRVYGRTLSDTEITAISNFESVSSNELRAQYKFEKDGECSVKDSSGNGNTGTLQPNCPTNAPIFSTDKPS